MRTIYCTKTSSCLFIFAYDLFVDACAQGLQQIQLFLQNFGLLTVQPEIKRNKKQVDIRECIKQRLHVTPRRLEFIFPKQARYYSLLLYAHAYFTRKISPIVHLLCQISIEISCYSTLKFLLKERWTF